MGLWWRMSPRYTLFKLVAAIPGAPIPGAWARPFTIQETQIMEQAKRTALFSAICVAVLSADKALSSQWDEVAGLFVMGGKVDDALFAKTRAEFVAAYVAAAGIKAVTAADVKASKGTKDEADAYDSCKRNGRSTFGMGTNRALARLGVERTKANTGGATATAPVPTVPAAESVAIIPPAVNSAFREIESRIMQFQSTAKLTKDDKEACGKLAECIRALGALIGEPAPTATNTK